MPEYIERKALLENLGFKEEKKVMVLPGSTFDVILKEPAADVTPVVHGRWVIRNIVTISQRNRKIKSRLFICSRCKCSNGRASKLYCPNCGAKMDLEVHHE